MIEALVRYIEERGFKVKVYPGTLYIYRSVTFEMEVGYSWRISRIELKYARYPIQYFFQRADDIMLLISKQISLL